MDKKSKERLASQIQDSDAEWVQSQACPACGGGLSIGFVPAGRHGRGAGSLFITCLTCIWRVISDGIPCQPPWVETLGKRIQTSAKPVPAVKSVRQAI